MTKLLFFILSTLLVLPCLGQNQEVFNRTYNNYKVNSGTGGLQFFNNDATFSILVLDNYYVIGGESENYLWSVDSNALYEAFYLKVDLSGDTVWQKSFNVVNEGIENVSTIVELNDKSFLMAGAIGDSVLNQDFDYESLLFKTDSLGNIVWYYTYDYLETDIIKDMISKEGFIYTLSVHAQYASFFKAFSCLSKMDTLGNVLWRSCLGDSINKPEGAGSFEIIDSKFYIPTTINDFINDSARLGLTIIDSQGVLVDTFRYYNNNNIAGGSHGNLGHYYDENGLHIIMTGQIQLSPNNQAGYIISIDENYEKEWERIIDAGPKNELFISCQVLPDGRIVAISYRAEYENPNPNSSTDEQCWLIMLDKQGNTIWERYINAYDQDFSDTYPYQIKTAQDGGFVITGYAINNQIQSNGIFNRNDAWLCKTDSCGFTTGAEPEALLTIDSVVGITVHMSNLSEEYCNATIYFGNGDSVFIYAYSQFSSGEDPTQIQYTYTDTGSYQVTLYAYAGDGVDTFATLLSVSDTSTGLLSANDTGLFNANILSLYPNPSQEYFILETDQETLEAIQKEYNKEWKGEIYTATGQLIQSFTYNSKLLQQRVFLNDLANGVYLIQVGNGSKTLGFKRLTVVR